MNTSIENESNVTERGQNLLPCPFCGSKKLYLTASYLPPSAYYLRCLDCGIEQTCKSTKDGAIKEWNRRAKTEEAQGQPPTEQSAPFTCCNRCVDFDKYPNCENCLPLGK